MKKPHDQKIEKPGYAEVTFVPLPLKARRAFDEKRATITVQPKGSYERWIRQWLKNEAEK